MDTEVGGRKPSGSRVILETKISKRGGAENRHGAN